MSGSIFVFEGPGQGLMGLDEVFVHCGTAYPEQFGDLPQREPLQVVEEDGVALRDRQGGQGLPECKLLVRAGGDHRGLRPLALLEAAALSVPAA